MTSKATISIDALKRIAAGEVEEQDDELGAVQVPMSGEEAAEIANQALAALSRGEAACTFCRGTKIILNTDHDTGEEWEERCMACSTHHHEAVGARRDQLWAILHDLAMGGRAVNQAFEDIVALHQGEAGGAPGRVTVEAYNEVYDAAEIALGGAFKDGFRVGWIFAKTPDGSDFEEFAETYKRAVDIEPSEAWEGYRGTYFSMLPLAALPTIAALSPTPAVAEEDQERRPDSEQMIAELCDIANSVTIYTVEGSEERLILRIGREMIATVKADGARGIALLKYDAGLRAALTKAKSRGEA